MYRTLYLVRHGQTAFNVRGLIQGRCDSPLTELGREQVRAAVTWLRARGVGVDAAFSSPAERACATAELLWAGPYVRLQGLAERSFGELEGTDVAALPKPMGDFPARFGGEGQAAVEARLTAALTAVMRGDFGAAFASEPGAGEMVAPVPGAGEVSAPVPGADGSPARVSGVEGLFASASDAEGAPSADGVAPVRAPRAGRSDAPIEPCALLPAPARTDAVLAVSHGAACKAFAQAQSAFAQVALPDPFPNCAILVFDFDGARFSLREVADPAAHLGGAGLSI